MALSISDAPATLTEVRLTASRLTTRGDVISDLVLSLSVTLTPAMLAQLDCREGIAAARSGWQSRMRRYEDDVAASKARHDAREAFELDVWTAAGSVGPTPRPILWSPPPAPAAWESVIAVAELRDDHFEVLARVDRVAPELAATATIVGSVAGSPKIRVCGMDASIEVKLKAVGVGRSDRERLCDIVGAAVRLAPTQASLALDEARSAAISRADLDAAEAAVGRYAHTLTAADAARACAALGALGDA